jgi:hypothetical protein
VELWGYVLDDRGGVGPAVVCRYRAVGPGAGAGGAELGPGQAARVLQAAVVLDSLTAVVGAIRAAVQVAGCLINLAGLVVGRGPAGGVVPLGREKGQLEEDPPPE